jgi:16S rRNA (cytosine1402-N4)-methyltransferase
MLHETVDGLAIEEGGVYADMTFGGGGHSCEILRRMDATGHLYSFDQDADAERNIVDDDRFTFVRSNFRYLRNWMRYHGVEQLDGVLADLGVSSHQLDVRERGFSYHDDAPLDMRMDQSQEWSAYDVVNTWSEDELNRVIRDFGEDKIFKNFLVVFIFSAMCASRVENLSIYVNTF